MEIDEEERNAIAKMLCHRLHQKRRLAGSGAAGYERVLRRLDGQTELFPRAPDESLGAAEKEPRNFLGRCLPTAVEGVNEKSFQVHLHSSFATDASRRVEYFLRFAPALWK